nr:unnamed protein product [Digitaria exilis]
MGSRPSPPPPRSACLYGPDDRAPIRVSRVEEIEEPIDPALALACADVPRGSPGSTRPSSASSPSSTA